MLPDQISPPCYEQRAFQIEQERTVALKLLGEREANAIALGDHFLRARQNLSVKEYTAYVKSLGLHILTAMGFEKQAKEARGIQPTPYKPRPKRNPEAEVLRELISLAERIGPEAAIQRAKELLNG